MRLFAISRIPLSLSALALAFGVGASGCCPARTIAETPKVVAPPDQDGDGVADADDRCPAAAGKSEFSGCPDTDGDGVPDDVDACKDLVGSAEFKGCLPPDKDGDGITDGEDRCSELPGPAETNGCPDKDGDGIADNVDKCPDQAGTPEEQGCLPAAVQKFAGSIKGITFDAGKATIKKSSNKTLDEAAQVLSQFKSLRVEVQGHTDDQGPDDTNLALSQARADSVKDYLVTKGVEADRVDAKGYGETTPVGDNTKGAGRAQNRRIEFKIGGSRRNLF